MSGTVKPPDDNKIDAALYDAIIFYDPNDKYPEWSNAMMRQAYLAGWEDGQRV